MSWKINQAQLMGLGAAAVGLTVFLQTTELGMVQTQSLPYRHIFIVKGLSAKRGDLVALKGHKTAYHPASLPYVKRLMGVPGDLIEIHNGVMFVAGKRVGPLRSQSKDGLPFTALKSQIIPPGFVFVAASSWDSFDSRYQEFGLVNTAHIVGKGWGWRSSK